MISVAGALGHRTPETGDWTGFDHAFRYAPVEERLGIGKRAVRRDRRTLGPALEQIQDFVAGDLFHIPGLKRSEQAFLAVERSPGLIAAAVMAQNLALILVQHLHKGLAGPGTDLRLAREIASFLVGITPLLHFPPGLARCCACIIDAERRP